MSRSSFTRARFLVPAALLLLPATAAAAPSDLSLDFGTAVPGSVPDAQGEGTGFTGIEGDSVPANLDLDTAEGVLRIVSTSGDFIDNTQDNGLYTEIDGAGGFAVRTTLLGPPPLSDPNHGAGIWVGADQDNYIKLVLIQVPERDADGDIIGSFPIVALGREETGQTVSFEVDPSSLRFDQMKDAERITLTLKVASDGSVSGRYSDDLGIVRQLTPTSPLTLTGITGPAVRSGVVATSKNAFSSPTFAFDDFTVEGDAGPSIINRSPASGAGNVGRTAPIRVVWDEPMDPAAVAAAFSLAGPDGSAIPASAAASADGRSFTFTPAEALAATSEHRVAITGPRRANGEPASDESWSFTTGLSLGSDPGSGGLGTGRCLAVPPRVPSPRNSQITLTAKQLRINQRISAAAVRRANALQKWIDDGITADDICGGAISRADLADDVVTTETLNPATPSLASPRPLVVPPPRRGSAKIKLTTRQLRINQRIASAALRRARALEVRLRNLTGGDLAPGGQISVGKLDPELAVLSLGATTTVASSVTRVRPPSRGGDEIERSVRQLRINQRISAAAVRTLNGLVDQVSGGLTSDNFRNRSVAGSDLASDARP